MHKCPLCQATDRIQTLYTNEKAQVFKECHSCGLIFRLAEHHMTLDAEKARYELHENNPQDLNYQEFLKPVVEAVLARRSISDQGMDFGCGPSSVISYLLKKQSYQVVDYDPFFHPDEKLLLTKYDYITCTEVVEHFAKPAVEFEKLRGLLKPGGMLIIKTSLTDDINDFSSWYYQRDPAHVSFYNLPSLNYIKDHYHFSNLEIFEKYLIFSV